jgi:small subunit ribosomal protein S20
MAHTHAALKHIRQTKKRTKQNTLVKKNLTYLRKQALKAIEKKDATKAQELSRAFTKAVDKAARKHIVKKNTAARKKSRLAKKIHALKQ